MAEELISFTRDSEPSSTGTWQTEWPYAACMGQDGGSNSSVVWEYCRVVGVAALPPPSSSSSSSSTTEYVPSATTIGARRCLTRCHVRPKLQREGVMFVQPSRGFDVMTIADARTVPVVLSGGSSNHSLAEVVEDILRLDGSEGEQHDDEIVSRWASTLPWSSNPPFQTPSWPWHRRHQRAASSLAAGGYFAGSNPRCGHMAVVVVTARLVGKVAALGGGGAEWDLLAEAEYVQLPEAAPLLMPLSSRPVPLSSRPPAQPPLAARPLASFAELLRSRRNKSPEAVALSQQVLVLAEHVDLLVGGPGEAATMKTPST